MLASELAVRTDLGRRIVRAWSIVPAAVRNLAISALRLAGRTGITEATR